MIAKASAVTKHGGPRRLHSAITSCRRRAGVAIQAATAPSTAMMIALRGLRDEIRKTWRSTTNLPFSVTATAQMAASANTIEKTQERPILRRLTWPFKERGLE